MGKPFQQLKTAPLAAFDPAAFAKLIQGRGIWYRWSRAVDCPCRLNSDTDQWDITCARCAGDGWMFVNPCAAQERHMPTKDYTRVRAIFSTVTDKPTNVEVHGEWIYGNATLTVQNEMRVGFRDRFIAEQQEMAYSEFLVRGAGDRVPVGLHGRTAAEQETAMRYEPVRINYVEDDDQAGTRTIYYEGLDFIHVGPAGSEPAHMQWKPGKGPPEGRDYVVHYDIRPVWLVAEGIYRIQNSVGPEAGLSGADVLQHLPTTFKVGLDFQTPKRGT